MKLNPLFIALSAALALFAQASKAEALLAGVKGTGMAAAVTAYPVETLSAAYNPAGMVEIGNRVDLGLTWAHYRGHSRVHGNTAPPFIGKVNGNFKAYKTPNFYTVDVGVNKMLGCDCQYSVGFILYNRNQLKTTYRKPFPLVGRSHPGIEYVHEQLGPVFGWKVNDILNIGVSVNINIQRVKAKGLENLNNRLFSKHPGHVTNREYSYSSGVGVTVGAQWHVTPCLTMGVAYTPECKMRRFHKYSGFLAQGGRLNLPQIVIAGISWRFVPCATICFDVEHDNWRRIRSIHNPLLNDAGRLNLLGSKNGPGFGWRSRTFYRLGVDYALNDCWTLRAGYRFAPTNIRRTQTVINQLTLEPLVEHVATIGATYAINECNELNSFFAYGFQKRLKGKHSIPNGFPFFGGNADIRNIIYALGVSWGWNY